MTMVNLPAPITWISLEDSEPPIDTWLLLYAEIDPEEMFFTPPPVMCGWYSSKVKCFLDEKYLCLSEHFNITHYAIATGADGRPINIGRADNGLPE